VNILLSPLIIAWQYEELGIFGGHPDVGA